MQEEEEAGSLRVVAGGPRGPEGLGSGQPGSYSWVGAGCYSWPTTTRPWIRRRTPDHCSSPGSGCDGAADASPSAHGLAATAAAPTLLPLLRPSSLVSNGVGGPLESAYQRHRGGPRGAGEGGRPGVAHDGSDRFGEGAVEEDGAVGRPQPRGWGSRPAGTKGGCPTGVAQRHDCD